MLKIQHSRYQEMKNIRSLAVVVLAMTITAPKLYKMGQIRGWISGAETSTKTITQKWHQTSIAYPSGGDAYWLAWSDTNIREVGDHRLNVTLEHWQTIDIGEDIEIVYTPRDSKPYLRDGIFASPGNFVFDIFLLSTAIVILIVKIVNFTKNRT